MPQPLADTFAFLAAELPFFQRFVFANLWAFESSVLDELERDVMSAAAIRDTVAVTIIRGGDKDATVPAVAGATIAVGILPGRTAAQTKDLVAERCRQRPRDRVCSLPR